VKVVTHITYIEHSFSEHVVHYSPMAIVELWLCS